MSRIAFYAPLKPPTHPVPSGDRAMARNLMAAINTESTSVDLVSDLRVFDPSGDTTLQSEFTRQADAEISRLIKELASNRPDAWVTYHNYYKAPDLVGPAVCKALSLPYVQIESTRSTRRLTGKWAGFATKAEAATDAADLVFYLTANDLITLKRERPTNQKLVHLPPFLPMETLPDAADCGAPNRPILAAGMMRAGDKLSSYRIIADALSDLSNPGWTLHISGDGPARPLVEEMMAPFGSRVQFLGQLDPTEMARGYQDAALFFWPGVNEAFGMVYLEAQAAGLPIVAQDRPGVRDVLLPGIYPAPEAGPSTLATALTELLSSPELRQSRGGAARNMIAKTHLLGNARETFWSAVTPLIGTHK